MAYLVERPGRSVQIRECVRTPDGPRSRTLASFRGALDDGVLDEATRRATHRFDRAALIRRARELGIGWESKAGVAARQLVAGLREGVTLDPMLSGLLREELADRGAAPLDDALREAAEWVGRDDEARATTLRGLLRLGDAIVRSRTVQPTHEGLHYPRIDSTHASEGR